MVIFLSAGVNIPSLPGAPGRRAAQLGVSLQHLEKEKSKLILWRSAVKSSTSGKNVSDIKSG